VRSLGLRQTRYIGLRKTALQHLLTAAAINLIRLDDFLVGVETEKTRISRFAALAPKEAA
jgi:transposase